MAQHLPPHAYGQNTYGQKFVKPLSLTLDAAALGDLLTRSLDVMRPEHRVAYEADAASLALVLQQKLAAVSTKAAYTVDTKAVAAAARKRRRDSSDGVRGGSSGASLEDDDSAGGAVQ